jgi:hypothetical protein
MSGGIARRPKRAKPVLEPEPETEPEMLEDDVEPELLEDEDEADVAMRLGPEPLPQEQYLEDVYPEDPEDHFVADEDATRDGKSETAD